MVYRHEARGDDDDERRTLELNIYTIVMVYTAGEKNALEVNINDFEDAFDGNQVVHCKSESSTLD